MTTQRSPEWHMGRLKCKANLAVSTKNPRMARLALEEAADLGLSSQFLGRLFEIVQEVWTPEPEPKAAPKNTTTGKKLFQPRTAA